MNKPCFLSIIIPMYNSELYIHRCIESVLTQSYRNFELICIDDGSTDNTYKIVEDVSSRDDRVKLVKQNNMGASIARNTGLKLATGSYIMFIDSDDWLATSALSKIIEYVISGDFDALIWPYTKVYDNSTSVQNIFDRDKVFQTKDSVRKSIHRRLFGPIENELKFPQKLDFLSTVHCKLYKAELIKSHKIKFEDIRVLGTSEDTVFNIDFFCLANSAYFIKESLYFHNKANYCSITSTYKPELKQKWDKLFSAMKSRIVGEPTKTSDYYTALENRRALSIVGLGLNEMLSTKGIISKYCAIKGLVHDKDIQLSNARLKKNAMPYHWKIFFQTVASKLTVLVFIQLLIIKVIIKK